MVFMGWGERQKEMTNNSQYLLNMVELLINHGPSITYENHNSKYSHNELVESAFGNGLSTTDKEADLAPIPEEPYSKADLAPIPKDPWTKTVLKTKLSLLKDRAISFRNLGHVLIIGSTTITGTLFPFIGPLSFVVLGVTALGVWLTNDSSKVIKGIELINECNNDDELAINVIRAECFSQSINIWFGRVGK